MSNARPILWHLEVSHYNEKARWALDHKNVEHERRAPPPGLHMLWALALTRGQGKTFPILRLEGRTIGDSTWIIEALEARFPNPPLYPDDPEERRRALELEDFFDEQLAPQIRQLVWHEAIKDRETFKERAAETFPGGDRARAVTGTMAAGFLRARFRAGDSDRAEANQRKVVEAMDRLEAELGDGDYLVGDGFTVADLTAASLFYPLVLPPEGPRVITEPPGQFGPFRESLSERRGYRWVEETFRKHRKPERATVASAPA
jgi:glutathione S-transferase